MLVGVALIVIGTFSKKTSGDTVEEFSCELYTSALEEKIERFLLNVDGIKNVEVIVTLDTSTEKVYAQSETSLNYLSIKSSDGQSPVHISEIYPKVRGIAVSCTNGDDDVVKVKITRLISAYLGISSNRIEIVSFG